MTHFSEVQLARQRVVELTNRHIREEVVREAIDELISAAKEEARSEAIYHIATRPKE